MLALNLKFGNDVIHDDFEYQWTFRSNLGVRRILNYIFFPANILVKFEKAINDVNLGSDHRAVQVGFFLLK